MRRVPGRMCGRAEQVSGNGKAFTLTLQAREQHIRRHRASSNICSNEALCALMATIHLTLLGKNGLARVAELNFHKAHYARKRVTEVTGVDAVYPETPFFNEFCVRLSEPASEVNARLMQAGYVGGFDLERDYPELGRTLLLAVTECRTKKEIDGLADRLRG